MRLFIDTNVYLEYFLKREEFDSVYHFFNHVILFHHQTYLSAMSLRDIGYIVHKYTHDIEKTRRIQLLAYKMTSKVASTSADSAIESLYVDENDYDDSLQYYVASETMCDAIITLNKKDYKQSKIPVLTPNELCDLDLKK